MTVTAKGGCTAFLPVDQLLTAELLSFTISVLNNAATKPTLAQRALQLLSNLGEYKKKKTAKKKKKWLPLDFAVYW